MSEKKLSQIEKDIALLKKYYFECSRVKNMWREYRYDLGEHTRKVLLSMSLSFDIGWASSDKWYKRRCFEDALGFLHNFQHSINELNDYNVIDNDTKAVLDMLTDKIDNQLTSLSSSFAKTPRDRAPGSVPPAEDSSLKGRLTAS